MISTHFIFHYAYHCLFEFVDLYNFKPTHKYNVQKKKECRKYFPLINEENKVKFLHAPKSKGE